MKTLDSYTPEQVEAARALQPEIKEFIASFPMHHAELTLQFALFHLQRVAVLESQIENLRSEIV